MRTIRSTIFHSDNGGDDTNSCSFSGPVAAVRSAFVSEPHRLLVDMRLGELALRTNKSVKSSSSEEEFLDLSQAFSDFSACSSDISGELQRLATLPLPALEDSNGQSSEVHPALHGVFAEREFLYRDNREHFARGSSADGEDLHRRAAIAVDCCERSAAAKLRLLAKNRADNRALIGESGAVPALIPLLRCSDRGHKSTPSRLC
ncbi:u-box domain-containing protein 13 [Quercus suber]|uniref:U-box domain-containing protein 13 n=1 Tax=Quercus suber TaxID=58331 RepID=A0AAW0J4F6_QUESU